MKNPCRECPRLAEDKNGPECMACEKRLAYNAGYGRPEDMGPMVNGTGTGGAMPPVGAGYDAGADDVRTKVCRGPLCRQIDPGGVEKPVSEFGAHPNTRDGLNGHCRACENYSYKQRKAREKTVGADLRAARKGGDVENQAGYGTTKVCRGPVCRALDIEGVERPLNAFGPSKSAKDGLLNQCRMCMAFDFKRRDAAKKGKPAPDPKAYAESYKNGKGGMKKDTKDTAHKKAPSPPPSPSRGEGVARAVAMDLFTDGGCIVVLDFSARPDLYQKIAERGARDILMAALEGE